MTSASAARGEQDSDTWLRIKHVVRDNGLSLVTGALFLICAVGTLLVGAAAYNQELAEHGQAQLSLGRYAVSGHFLEAIFENWESEFLQMGLLVLLTVRLFQRGSAESNDPDRPDAEEETGERARDAPWPVRRGGFVLKLYEHSLSIALLALFLISFLLHGLSGLRQLNAENAVHGEAPIRLGEYFASSKFWYQSFQNWQSEFLAFLSIVVLSIFLRQRGSPQSKPVSAPHSKTGH